MSTKNNGGAAFPCAVSENSFTNQGGAPYQSGMSLRDWFAGQALAGLMSATDSTGMWTATGAISEAVNSAYKAADMMLQARAALEAQS